MASSSTAAPRSNVRNARYTVAGQPYICNLCQNGFGTQYSLKRHFDQVCFAKHNRPAGADWDDHPSCLTTNMALFQPGARPFYPSYQSIRDGVAHLTWPALCGWPTNAAELERKNAAHAAIPGSNPHCVDTPGNVYADVREDTEEHVAGESPLNQLKALIQLVTVENMNFLLTLTKNGNWKHGAADDYFLALSMHKSDSEVVALLGVTEEVRAKWFDQAAKNFYVVHVRVTSGPNASVKLLVPAQEVAWNDLLGAFRLAHVGENGASQIMGCCDGGFIDEVFAEIEGQDDEE